MLGAYIKGDSTIQQLPYITNLLRKSWTKGCITLGSFLDVSAAFDKCLQKGVLAKLKQAKIDNYCYNLFFNLIYQTDFNVQLLMGLKVFLKKLRPGSLKGPN